MNRGIISFKSGNGKVLLQDGYNTTLRVNDGKVVLDINAQAGLGYECPGSESLPRGVSMINGQHADSGGSFSFVAGPGIKIGQGSYNDVPGITIAADSQIDSMAGRG